MKNIIFVLIIISTISYFVIQQDASAQIPAVPTFDPTPPPPTITIDQRPPVLNNNLVLTIRDFSLANDQVGDTIQVLLENLATSDTKTVALTEINDTGVFVLKYIKFTNNVIGINDLLASAGNEIRISYRGATINDNITLSFTDQVLPKTQNTEKIGCSLDVDGDKLCDEWETLDGLQITWPGTNITYTYPCDPVCPSPTTPDIYVEVDYMNGHDPDLVAIEQVKSAYANAGINLHVQIDENVINHKDSTKFPGSNSRFPTNAGFDQIKERWHGSLIERTSQDPTTWSTLWKEKKQAFHYALFVHKFAGGLTVSGIAEKPGNDMMISLGAFTGSIGSTDEQAGTFMHELGHNLGLDHGGPIAVLQDSQINCKPNYISVMSYTRQFSNLISDRELDYSRMAVDGIGINADSLSETYLSEIGLTAHPGNPRIIYGPIPPIELPRADGISTIDWNVDGQINTVNTVLADANNLSGCQSTSTSDTFRTKSDWSNLNFDFKSIGETWGSGAEAEPTNKYYAVNEITIDNVRKHRESRITTIQCFLNLDVGECARMNRASSFDYLDAVPAEIKSVQYDSDIESDAIEISDFDERDLKENLQYEENDDSMTEQSIKMQKQSHVSMDDAEIYKFQNQEEINKIKKDIQVITEEIKALTTDSKNPDQSLNEAVVKLQDFKQSLEDYLQPSAYNLVSKNIDDTILSYEYALTTQPNIHSSVKEECPNGMHLEQELCIPDIPPCPPGYHADNGQCVPDTWWGILILVFITIIVIGYLTYRLRRRSMLVSTTRKDSQ